jgi:ribosomal protein S18 acetylase RimI-like enzyme/uncharacterized glyoxalase superfamily protein PhnB
VARNSILKSNRNQLDRALLEGKFFVPQPRGIKEEAVTKKMVPMIHVPDVRATVDWYQDIGFTVTDSYGNDADGLSFAVLSFGSSEVMFNQGGQPSTKHRREVDLYLYTDDVDELYQRLKDRVEVVEEPHDKFYGRREVIIRDLNRFWITFSQPSLFAKLMSGVMEGNTELVRSALKSGVLNPESLAAALTAASVGDKMNAEIAELLKEAGAVRTPIIEQLIPPVADSDIRALAEILIDAVESGAAVSFVAPLSLERAEDWWRSVISASHSRAVFLVARDLEGITGTVQLHPAWAPNQPQRADIAKLIVHRRSQGSGLGTRLMQRIEDSARDAGFRLLTLDAKRGGAAAHLYARQGWQRVGTIPNYAVDPDGTPHDTVIFYKELC